MKVKSGLVSPPLLFYTVVVYFFTVILYMQVLSPTEAGEEEDFKPYISED